MQIKTIFPVVCCLFLAAACTDETAINKVLGISADSPMFTGYKVVSGTEVDFSFTKPVSVISVSFSPPVGVESSIDGQTVAVNFSEDRSGGQRLTADILVQDDDGNTLNVLVPFCTRNDRVPEFVINEIRLAASKPKSEFVEIFTKTAGNLGAVRLYAASTSITEPIYEFPPVEVGAGDYIILHLRTYPNQPGCIDELDGNLGAASITGTSGDRNDAPSFARDLWIPSNQKYLHNSDVIYMTDQDDMIIDAVVFSDSSAAWDKNKNLSKAAENLAKQGAWLDANGVNVKTPEFSDAVNVLGTTATKTLNRIEARGDNNIASDWFICEVSGNSPGKLNAVP